MLRASRLRHKLHSGAASRLEHCRERRISGLRISPRLLACLLDYFDAAVLAHLASVFRKGNAFGGASMVPVSEVLKGTMRP